jgi:hypothetical protein
MAGMTVLNVLLLASRIASSDRRGGGSSMLAGRRPSPAWKWWALIVSGALIVALPWISGAEEGVHDNGPSLVVAVTAPTSGATLSGVVKVEGTATAKGGIAGVEIGVDDGTFVRAQGAGSWTFMLDTTAFVRGSHQIVARATTKSGSVGTSSVDVRFADALPVDVTPPSITIGTPAEGAAVAGTITVSGSALDVGGIAMIDIRVDGGNATGLPPAKEWSTTIDTPKFANGPHDVTVRAVDNAGNVGTASEGSDDNPAATPSQPTSSPSTSPPEPACAGLTSPSTTYKRRSTLILKARRSVSRPGCTRSRPGYREEPAHREPGAVIDGQGVATRNSVTGDT